MILLDHQGKRPTKAEQQAADEKRMAESIQQIAEAAADKVAQHYAAQTPGLVAVMIAQILKANGMDLKPPPEWEKVEAVAPKALDSAQQGVGPTGGGAASDSTDGQDEAASTAVHPSALRPVGAETRAPEASREAENGPSNGQDRPGSTLPEGPA